jgi:outer membrane protein TolC
MPSFAHGRYEPNVPCTPRRRYRRPALGSASFAVAICAVGTIPAARAAVPTPTTAAASPLVEVNDPMLEPVARPPRTVRTWAEVASLLKSRSIDLLNAYVEVKRAEGQWRQALANTLLSVNGNGAAVHHFLTKESIPQLPGAGNLPLPGTQPPAQVSTRLPTPDSLQFNVNFTQPLVNGAVWHNIRTASLQEDVAKLSVDEVKRQLTTTVAGSVVAVVVAERVSELNRNGLRAALERLEITRRRQNLGATTALDVSRAEQDVEAARGTLISGDETLRQAREALGLTLGLPEQVAVAPDISLDAIAAQTEAVCTQMKSLDERPDLQVSRERLHVANRQHDNVWYQFLPSISAVSSLTGTTLNQGAFPNVLWNIQGVLQVPLWDGGARYGALKQTEAAAKTAENNLELVRRRATLEVVQSRRLVDVTRSAMEVAHRARDHAADVDRLTRVAFQEGRGTSLELVTAAANLRQGELQLAQRELEHVRAKLLALLALARCDW